MTLNSNDDEVRALREDVRSRQWHTRAPKKLSDVLSGLMSRRGYAQLQTAAQSEQAWRAAVGVHLAKHTRPGQIRRGVFEVTVRNSSILQELTFQKKQLLKKLAQLLPEQGIRELRFRVASW